MRVAIVGGGISGLSAARRARELGGEAVVFEQGPRAGGMLRTERVDGFVIERGPDSILTTKPAALEAAEALGLAPRIVRTAIRGAHVVRAGALVPVPKGFQLVAPADLDALERSGLMSAAGMARVREEPNVAPRDASVEDESLGSFVRRRFGEELLTRLAQPMAGGIYGADPDKLSLRATMPRFLDMELAHGSVIRALQATAAGGAADAQGARYGLFISFDTGIGTLAEALVSDVQSGERTELRLDAAVKNCRRVGGHYEVMGERFDGLVVALQGWRAAALVSDFGAELAQALAAIPFGSGAIVTFGLDESQLDKPLDAAGFVVPAAEGREIMASTYSSAKWAGRAPAGKALLRAFLGGHTHGHVAEWDDARLQAVAWRNLRELVGIRGEPELVRVDRWRRVMPRYHVDHLRRIEAIERMVSEYPAFSLAGNSYRGVGIPDSIRSGQRAADQVFAAAG